MKPRIRPKKNFTHKNWYECRGTIPGTQIEGWGYGRTIEEAYWDWIEHPIPF